MNLTIVVADRGFVFVAAIEQHPRDAQMFLAYGCHCVRIWGTNAGLGQLAREGARPQTVLDRECDHGPVEMSRHYVLRTIPTSERLWPEVVEWARKNGIEQDSFAEVRS
ncbi:hypothetical protein [Brasilonema bromeliae]|uniref:hypothetical protein n=1 Tax=Brasilonema bromeliae TaxID=383615 RepID=UPI00145D26E8